MKNVTYLLLLLLFFTACKKGDLKPIAALPCTDTLQHDIVSVSGPTKASINQEATFNISWKAINGCDQFVNFQQDTAGTANMIYLKAYASHDSCSTCVTNAKEFKTASYKFKPAKSGTYYLRFYKTGNDYNTTITDTLLVE